MKNFGAKLKLIFLPFLIIAIVTTVIYTSLRWFLFIRTTFFVVDEEILNLWAPFVIPWIPILIWLRPRIKLLDLKNKSRRGDPLSGYMMVAWIAMVAPICIAQAYLVTATGKLTNLDNMGQITEMPVTKYYEAKHFYVDKRLVRVKSTFGVSGKYNDNFDMTIYAPCPIFDMNHPADSIAEQHLSLPKLSTKKALIVLNGQIVSIDILKKINPVDVESINVLKGADAIPIYGDAAKNGVLIVKLHDGVDLSKPSLARDGNKKFTPVAWLAVKYQRTISNHLSDAEKNTSYKQFANESQKEFDEKDFNDFIYLDRISYSTDEKNYTAAITDNKYGDSNGPVIILSPVNEAFEARNGSKLEWIYGSLGIGAAVFLIILLFKPLRSDALTTDIETQTKKDRTSALIWVKGLFIPKKGRVGTQILVGLNLLIFIIMVCRGLGFISFNGEDLLKWGANYRPLTMNGEYWRLVTSIFLHGGLLHVLFNMYGLFFVGIFLEPVMGTRWYVLAYLFTGIVASLTSVWWHPATVSVGASGAIFGLYGVFFAYLTVNIFPPDIKKSVLINTAIFIGYNLLFGLTGGIDNAAHIGGLISGLLLGYITYSHIKGKLHTENAEAETQQILDKLKSKPSEPLAE